MLYTIGLTTIWKHVGNHLVFKDGEGTVTTSMSQFLKLPMAGGVRVGKGTALTANEAAKDRAVGKRVATEGASQRTKKKKTVPLSFALSDSEADGSNRSGSGTYHSASPLNIIIPNEAELTTGGDGLVLEYVNRVEEDTDHHFDNVEDTTEVNSPLSEHSPRSQHSNPSDEDTHNVRNELAHTQASGSTSHGVSSSSGGSHRRAFLGRNPGGDGIGSPTLVVQTRSRSRAQLTSAQYEDTKEQVHLGCVKKEADLTENLAAVETERGDLLDKDREREERIRQLEADLASNTSSLTEAKCAVSTLKGDLECLTVDLSHAEIIRHNYEGVKAACSEEEAEAFLATAADYDPACKTTFMSEFDSLFNKSYPYVEKLVESFRLPLGDLQNMWPEGIGPTLSGNAADVQ
ncbi:hypothetical protein Tco_0669082 [Tanacetum coccineum]